MERRGAEGAQAQHLSAAAGSRERLFLIDGANLAYRSYFAFIRQPLISSKGLNTSGAFGFTQTLLKILEEVKPEYVTVVWDPEGETERSRAFPAYKGTRAKMPDEMEDSLPYIDRICEGFRVPQILVDGVEADDVIGTLATRAADRGLDVYIVSFDEDFLQLVRPNLRLYNLRKGWNELEVMGPDETRAKYGVGPERIRDVLALMGDPSDNIPGVKGVGEKTAIELVQEHGSLEGVLARAAEVKRKNVREALQGGGAADARLSYDLVTIRTDVPVPLDLEALRRQEPDPSALAPIFLELEFTQFLSKIGTKRRAVAADYEIVRTERELDLLIARLRAAPLFAFDTETTSLDPLACDIVGFSFSSEEGKASYVPTYTPGVPGTLFSRPRIDEGWLRLVVAKLAPLLEDERAKKGGQNVKFDMLALSRYGVEVRGIAFDTMIASYLCDPAARLHNLDALSLRYLDLQKIPTEALLGKGKGQVSMLDIPVEEVARYAAEDADFTLRLEHVFEPKLRALEVEALYRDVELPLISVLARVERAGVKLDTAILGRLSAEYEERLGRLAEEIFALAGERFNIDSPKQLGPVLFEKLEVQKKLGVRVKRLKTGYSTDADVLELLRADPVVAKILEYRSLRKLKGTYLDALPALVAKDGVVHTSFNQAVAATGRLSSSDPNLQNIPIRGEEGRKIRAAFVPRAADRSILSADYSQVELRVLAHVTEDPLLVETFRAGEDVHRATAARVFGVAPEAVTPDLRAKAKVINFGIIYGMGPQRLARETGMSAEEAARFIEQYFEKFPGIRRYIDETIRTCERTGAVETIFKRRRLIPEIGSPNPRLRAAARNMAVNTPIQGSAADLIKVAMVRIDRRLAENHYQTQMILQVHDELVFDAPDRELADVEALVRHEMESAFPGFRVPLRVDTGAGKSWLDAH
jgi:DNA polymerase-1